MRLKEPIAILLTLCLIFGFVVSTAAALEPGTGGDTGNNNPHTPNDQHNLNHDADDQHNLNHDADSQHNLNHPVEV